MVNVFYSWGLADASSSLMFFISSFNDHSLMLMLTVVILVLYVLLSVVVYLGVNIMLKDSEVLEIGWILLPCVVLLSLAAPSLQVLYLSDDKSSPLSVVKVMGHQWFWSYEYESGMSYSSYMVPTQELMKGDFRLLEVDNSVFLPYGELTRLSVSSSDVIHAWACPSLGLKVDAIPGRINYIVCLPSKMGTFYGQCSEICGAMHSFMPIKVEIVSAKDYVMAFMK